MGCAPSLLNDENEDEKNNRKDISEQHRQAQSLPLESLLSSENPYHLLSAYIQIDKQILQEENQSPASMFGQSVAKKQQIKQILQPALEAKEQSSELIPNDSSIQDLFMDLNLNRGFHVAAEHEEFIASVNRRALNQNLIEILGKKLLGIDEKLKNASARVSELQNLYQQQDTLLGNIFGETYGSEKEKKLEQEMDTLRNYRDTLSSGATQWQDCAHNVQTAADLLQKAVSAWRNVQNQKLERKISLATEARNCIQESVLLVQMSQESLPGVQFPYCTTRELNAILQAIEYVFTDILIEERYLHAMQVYKNFHQRAVALHQWINQMLNSSLKKDLYEIDEKITDLSNKLRNERIQLICEKLGIENNYHRFGLNPGVKNIRPHQRGQMNPRQELISPIAPPYGEHHNKKFSKFQEPMLPENRYTQQNLIMNQDRGMLEHENFSGINLGPTLGLNTGGGFQEGRIFQDPNIQMEFERKLAARQNAMWPSRRIEELRMLTLNHLDH